MNENNMILAGLVAKFIRDKADKREVSFYTEDFKSLDDPLPEEFSGDRIVKVTFEYYGPPRINAKNR